MAVINTTIPNKVCIAVLTAWLICHFVLKNLYEATTRKCDSFTASKTRQIF